MNLFQLGLKNFWHRPWDTVLSVVLFSLGVAIISTTFHYKHFITSQLERNIKGIDMVVGAKGSPMQLILSAVFHIDKPTGNIPIQEATFLMKNRYVQTAIPLSYGDSYQEYRIVGTDHRYLELFEGSIAKGEIWQDDFEVVIGKTVAHSTGLDIGDDFQGIHGFSNLGETHNEAKYTVVGILESTGTVLDQLILSQTESIWRSHHIDDSSRMAFTALLIKFKGPRGFVQLPGYINEKTNLQAALPTIEVTRIMTFLKTTIMAITYFAFGIVIISGISVLISLYNILKTRKYEIAILRSYGATRIKIFILILQQGLMISITGFITGMLLSRFGMYFLSLFTGDGFHYKLAQLNPLYEELILFIFVVIIGLSASILPAFQGFRQNISKTLNESN